MFGENWRKIKLDLHLKLCTKVDSKWIKHLPMKGKSIKLITDNVEDSLTLTLISCMALGRTFHPFESQFSLL